MNAKYLPFALAIFVIGIALGALLFYVFASGTRSANQILSNQRTTITNLTDKNKGLIKTNDDLIKSLADAKGTNSNLTKDIADLKATNSKLHDTIKRFAEDIGGAINVSIQEQSNIADAINGDATIVEQVKKGLDRLYIFVSGFEASKSTAAK